MDELIRLVVQKTGISQDDARKAVEVIVSGDMSGGLNTLTGEAGEMLKGKLGNLFGGAK